MQYIPPMPDAYHQLVNQIEQELEALEQAPRQQRRAQAAKAIRAVDNLGKALRRMDRRGIRPDWQDHLADVEDRLQKLRKSDRPEVRTQAIRRKLHGLVRRPRRLLGEE